MRAVAALLCGGLSLSAAHAADANGTPVVRYEDFGAVGDGVANDLEAVRAAHKQANASGLPVRAKDGAVYNLGNGKGNVEIRTDVDFGTATFVIDDVGAGSGNNIFVVPPSRAEFSLTSQLSGLPPPVRGQANLGVTLPCKCLVQVNDSTTRQFVRQGANENTGAAQTDVVIVDADGRIDPSAPFVWDFSTVTSAKAYPIDEKPLTLKGGVFKTIANQTPLGDYFGRGIRITRSNVRVEGLRRVIEGELTGDANKTNSSPYTGFVAVSLATDVTLANCVFAGHRIYYKSDLKTSRGSYDVQVKSSVGVTLLNCTQTNSITSTSLWGVFASNYSKNLTFDGCVLSRFDAHCGVGNATIRNSTLGHQGVNAIGFGRLLLENTTVKGSALVNLRSDYGSLWRGEFIVRNCVFAPRNASSSVPNLFTPKNDETWDFGYACTMPWRITIDGLEIQDAASANLKSYAGPYLFSNPNSTHTSEAQEWTHPYAVTERVTLRNVTTASGQPLRTSPNACMFRNTAIARLDEEGEVPLDIDLAFGETVSDWNWTNLQCRVDVSQLDAEALSRGNGRLTMMVRDGSGGVVCERSQPVTAAGSVLFDVDLPTAGAFYSAEVRAYDDFGEIFYATRANASERFVGAQGGFWFSAKAAGDESVVTNGGWRAPRPAVSSSAYVIDKAAAFDVEKPSVEAGLVAVETSCRVNEFWAIDDVFLPDEGHVSFIAASVSAEEAERGSAFWYAARPDAGGCNDWVRLDGSRPKAGRDSVFRVTIDRTASPMRARYAVKNEGESEFAELRAEDGSVWLPTLLPADWEPETVAFVGKGRVSSLRGETGDNAVAEIGGVRYSDINAALRSAAESGQDVCLLTDVSLLPRDQQGLERVVTVRPATDEGRARLVVPSGETLQLATIVGFPNVDLVVEPGGRVSLAEGRHGFKSLTVNGVVYPAGTYGVRRGPDAVRSALSGAGLLRIGPPPGHVLILK